MLDIIKELHTCGISNTEIATYLGLSPASVTLISQGKRSGEKYRQKLILLLEQQRKKFETIKSYETTKMEQSLERIQEKTDWEIAHYQGKDRIQELNESTKWLKEWTQELRAACRLLGISYPRGYKPDGNAQEQELVARAHEKRFQIEHARQNINTGMSQIKQRVIESIPQTQLLSYDLPMLSAPSSHDNFLCAKCGGGLYKSGVFVTHTDRRNYHSYCVPGVFCSGDVT